MIYAFMGLILSVTALGKWLDWCGWLDFAGGLMFLLIYLVGVIEAARGHWYGLPIMFLAADPAISFYFHDMMAGG